MDGVELRHSKQAHRIAFHEAFTRLVPHYQPIPFELFNECYQQATAVMVDGKLTGGFVVSEGWNLHYGKVLDLHIVKVSEEMPIKRILRHLRDVAKANQCTGIIHSKHTSARRMELVFIPAGD